MNGLTLSVLDQSPISEGSTGAQSLANTLDLARLADEAGYHRYWVAEHHGTPMLAGPAPEALIGPTAAATSRPGEERSRNVVPASTAPQALRVGSGGVMLPHYSPFKVAETFSVLSGLFPGRIDLGLGRAAGTDPVTTHALQRDRSRQLPDDFPQQLGELLAYLEDRLPADHPFARLTALPGLPGRPEPWLLGSSQQSAIWAAELGLPYAFADFINPRGAGIADLYRQSFTDSERLPAPRTAVCVWTICADTDEEAERLASSARMGMSLLRRGQLIPVPPVEKALRYFEDTGARSESPRRRAVLGSPATVRAGLEQVAAEYGAEEVMLVTITFDHEARRHSYELIAEELGLRRRVADLSAAPGGG